MKKIILSFSLLMSIEIFAQSSVIGGPNFSATPTPGVAPDPTTNPAGVGFDGGLNTPTPGVNPTSQELGTIQTQEVAPSTTIPDSSSTFPNTGTTFPNTTPSFPDTTPPVPSSTILPPQPAIPGEVTSPATNPALRPDSGF